MNTVFVVARHRIKPGKLDEFMHIGKAAFEFARDMEPETYAYRWYFDAAHTMCTVIQHYPTAAAFLTHVENMRQTRIALDAVCDTSVEVFGNLTPEMTAILTPFGVNVSTPFMTLER
jgi:quinol monooxygenase YgiN